jgi:hypothetical protein
LLNSGETITAGAAMTALSFRALDLIVVAVLLSILV